MRSAGVLVARLVLAACPLAASCGDAGPADLEVGFGVGGARVARASFDMSFTLADGSRLASPDSDDPALGLISFGVATRLNRYRYYDPLEPEPAAWVRPGRVSSSTIEPDADGTGRLATLRIEVPPEVGSALVLELHWSCRPSMSAPRVCGTDVRMTVEDPAVIMFTRLSWGLSPDEALYGLGERFDHPNARGRKHAMQMLVGGTSSGLNEVHVPIPWVVSTRGYAVLMDEVRPGALDLGATEENVATATFASGTLSFTVVTGWDPWEVAGEIAHRTGMPRLPPAWAFGPQMWRNELEDGAELLADARAIRDNDLPVSVLWIDNPWQTAYNDFTFNPIQFPGAPSMIGELHDRGFRVLTWSTPYLDTSDDSGVREGMSHDTGGLYEEARAQGWFIRNEAGGVFSMPWTSGKVGGMIDFTDAEAGGWWSGLVGRATGLGIDGFKLDYGELTPSPIPGSRLGMYFADGTSEQEMHALYSVSYHRAYREALRRDRPEGFIIGRASTIGGQAQVDCIWPGDLDRDFSDHREINAEGEPAVGGLPAAVHAMQSLSVSGFPTFGSDTGGYRGGAPASEVLVRWAAHTAFSPVMQIGGGGDSHNPWDRTLYPEDWVLPAMRKFMKTHQRLVPYLHALAARAAESGVPAVMPAGLAYPDDVEARADGCSYLLGERMLVAPACRGEDSRRVHLPPGTWVDWWNGDVRSGPADVDVPNPIDSIPVFLGAGAVIPLFPADVDTMVPTTDPATAYAWESEGALVFRVVPAEPDHPGSGVVLGPDGEIDASLAIASDGECQRFDLPAPVVSARFPATVVEVDWQAFSQDAPSSAGGFTAAAGVEDVLDGCDRCWFFDGATGKVYASPIPGSICR